MDNFVSVIVPVYNVQRYLDKCLTSIINQTYQNLQIIIIDDGSTDSSGKICDEYANNDKRINIIHKKNGGLSSARNEGMKLAKGEYLSFVDSDDWLDLDFYETMVNFMVNYSVDIVMCGAKIIKNSEFIGNRFIYEQNNFIFKQSLALEMILEDRIGSQVWCKLTKRKLWENIKFPENRLYEDIPTTYKIFLNCSTNIGFIANPLYNYVIHEDSLSFKKNPLKNYHIYLGFMERYEFSKNYYKKSYDYCLALCCDKGLNVIFDDYLNSNFELVPYLKNLNFFIQEHRKEIMASKILGLKRKTLFFLYFYNKKLLKKIILYINNS